MRAFALLLLQIVVHGFIPGYFRHGPIIRILKIEEPVVDDRWEDGEVSWIFNGTESDGNTTSVLLPIPPFAPLTPVKVYETNLYLRNLSDFEP
jgi:hypothetical protein